MSSSYCSTADRSERSSHENRCGDWSGRGDWSGFNIAAMVLGFVFFWPVGLFFLYWILKGRSVKDLPRATRRKWHRMTGGQPRPGVEASDNEVFNEYQQTQFDRIREIKAEIKDRSRRFAEFRANARRRADEEEFSRFMSEAPAQGNTSQGNGGGSDNGPGGAADTR